MMNLEENMGKKLFSIRELIRANFLRFIDMDLPAKWHVLNKMYKLPNTRHQHSISTLKMYTPATEIAEWLGLG